MSKRVDATITCPRCGNEFQFSLYRTIWGEYEENKQLVMTDEINVSTCPACKSKTKLEYPFMYVDIKKQFAVWWEPINDPQIDKDAIEYGKMFGQGNFYQMAPRIRGWVDFKKTILRYYSGELKGNPISISNQQKDAFEDTLRGLTSQMKTKQKNKGGCLNLTLTIIMFFVVIIYIIDNLN